MKNILLATDFSDFARTAYPTAASLSRDYGSVVHLVHEVPPAPPFYIESPSPEFPVARYYEEYRTKLEEERRHPDLEDVTVEAHLLYYEEEYEFLLDYLEGEPFDLVILASHGRTGLPHVLMGSFAEKVVRHSPVPVLTCRREGRTFAPRKVLVPFDFSDNAQTVLPAVRGLAKRYSPQFTFLFVVGEANEPVTERFADEQFFSTLKEAEDAAAAKAEQKFQALHQTEFPDARAVFATHRGRPKSVVLEKAESLSVDLILLATHGRTGLRRLIMGSVAEATVRQAPCSVLTIRPERVSSEDQPSGSPRAEQLFA